MDGRCRKNTSKTRCSPERPRKCAQTIASRADNRHSRLQTSRSRARHQPLHLLIRRYHQAFRNNATKARTTNYQRPPERQCAPKRRLRPRSIRHAHQHREPQRRYEHRIFRCTSPIGHPEEKEYAKRWRKSGWNGGRSLLTRFLPGRRRIPAQQLGRDSFASVSRTFVQATKSLGVWWLTWRIGSKRAAYEDDIEGKMDGEGHVKYA